MAFTSVGSFGTIANATAGTTLALVPTVTIEAGNLAVIAIGVDNENQTGDTSDFGHLADTVASVTDDAGNVWELCGCVQSNLTADGGSCTSLWKSVLDTQLTTSSTITITFGVSRVAKAATGWEFEIDGTEVSIEHVRHFSTTGAGDVPSVTLDDLPSQEYLAIRTVASENRTVSFTPTTGFTAFTQAIGDSGASGTSMHIGAEFDIFTGTTTTSDPTKTTNDPSSLFVALKEGPQDKPVVLASNLFLNFAVGGSPRWPQGHKTNDIALMVCETGAEAVTFTTANGFAAVDSSPQITSETRLSVFWCRATSDAMAAPVIPDIGDHLFIKTFLIRGCIPTGDPWDVVQGSAKDTPSTSVSITGLTTTVDETLVVSAVADGADVALDEFSAWANSSLTRFRELDANSTQQGNGGGFGVAVGRMATAGVVSATTATTANSADNANLMIAFKPAVVEESVELALISSTTIFAPVVTGMVALNHLGPTAILNQPVINASVALDHIASTVVHQPVSVAGINVGLAHIGPTATVLAPSVAANVLLGHIATTTLFSPQINAQIVLSAISSTVLTAPDITLAPEDEIQLPHLGSTVLVFTPQLNSQINLGHISTTVVFSPVTAVIFFLDSISSTVIFDLEIESAIALTLIADTQVFAPQLNANIALDSISSTVLFAPSFTEAFDLPHISPTTTLFNLEVRALISLDHISSTALFDFEVQNENEVFPPHFSTTTLYTFSVENIIYESPGPGRILVARDRVLVGGDRVLRTS